jgi:hypothetical protein
MATNMKQLFGVAPTKWAVVLATVLTVSHTAFAAALDDIRIDISHDSCEGFGDTSFTVYATNLNSNQTIDANFKYDSVPAQQHFILFDAALNPITDRFPKFRPRRLAPREVAKIGCTFTYRAAAQPPGPLPVPIVIVKQSASYVEPGAPQAQPDDARSFAAFYLQDGINECAPGAKPPGLFYLLNLHPFARLSASMNLLDDRGARVGTLTPNLSPLSAMRVACSNGSSKPGPITSASLEVTSGIPMALSAPLPPVQPQTPEPREVPGDAPALAPLALGTILATQNVCAGSIAPGWIKINDAWNPTVCGNPATITYNVWTIEQMTGRPIGAVIHACKGAVPSGWAVVGTVWNPTVCGHPTGNQPNVMAIKRLN